MLAITLGTAVYTAWSGSTSAGGDYDDEVRAVVSEVAKATPLTPLCRTVALRLARYAVAGKVTEYRPTGRLWKGREDEAAGIWEAARCPTRALVGLAYGTSRIANTAPYGDDVGQGYIRP